MPAGESMCTDEVCDMYDVKRATTICPKNQSETGDIAMGLRGSLGAMFVHR